MHIQIPIYLAFFIKYEIKRFINGYKRKYPFKIEPKEGLSGCVDLTLVAINQIKGNIATYKKYAHLHISMHDKLNESLPTQMWLGDFIEFLRHIDEEHLRYNASLNVSKLKKGEKQTYRIHIPVDLDP